MKETYKSHLLWVVQLIAIIVLTFGFKSTVLAESRLSQNEKGEYCIGSEEDYFTFIEDVRNDESFADKTIILTNDIKVTGKEYSGAYKFSGNFDGQDHEIDFTANCLNRSVVVFPFNIPDGASFSNLRIHAHETLQATKCDGSSFFSTYILTLSLNNSSVSKVDIYGDITLLYDKAGQSMSVGAIPPGYNNTISDVRIALNYDYDKTNSIFESNIQEVVSNSFTINLGAIASLDEGMTNTSLKNVYCCITYTDNMRELVGLFDENKNDSIHAGIVIKPIYGQDSEYTIENFYFDSEIDPRVVIGNDSFVNMQVPYCSLSNEESFARSTADMKLKETYFGFDFDDTWDMSDKVYNSYPFIVAQAVKAVKKLIADLPAQITDADKDAVKAAKDAYDALTDDQKLQLSADIVQKLNDAVKAIEKEDEPDQKNQEKKSETQKLKKGTKFTVGANKYQVTGDKTATFIGAKNKKVKKITVPASVTYKKQIFEVTAIGPKACKGYKKLATFTVGKNVTTIGAQAFANTPKLKKIKVQSMVLKKVGAKACKGMHKKGVIKVPKKMLKKYKKLFKGKGQKKTVKIK